jgi:hypothetical protein
MTSCQFGSWKQVLTVLDQSWLLSTWRPGSGSNMYKNFKGSDSSEASALLYFVPERQTEFRYVDQSEFTFQILESDVIDLGAE